eukprot:m.42518 g.42518  ORF g.42518 m.42518 type:complete len:216 (+) comp19138_c0_seq2:239-886(+)
MSNVSWEYQLPNCDPPKYELYKQELQKNINDAFERKDELVKIKKYDSEIIFDHEHGNHREHNLNTKLERVVRRTLFVQDYVQDWNTFMEMPDVSMITKLVLDGCGRRKLDDLDTPELLAKLNECKSLENLILANNELTDEFGVRFGEMLATNSTLIDLDLQTNKFTEATGLGLELALNNNRTLLELNVSGNLLKEEGGAAIIRGLRDNKTLRVLS